MDDNELNQFDVDALDNFSDEELQEAFAAGVIKPGLNIPFEKREFKNNINGLKAKLKDFKLNLNWVEKLDLVNIPAPVPPEIFDELTGKPSEKIVKLNHCNRFNSSNGRKDTMNDFKREMLFHRQAQAAVAEGLPKLKSLGILTKRPDDYFAEMAKTDQHMHKIRQNLVARQTAAAQSLRAKEMRRLKKLGKKAQAEANLQQAVERKKMLNEVKKYKKGLRKDLNFLDNPHEKKTIKRSTSKQKKRDFKNEKFGFGGKKKGSKRNTKESTSYMGSLTKKGKKSRLQKNKRLGKSKRIKKRSHK